MKRLLITIFLVLGVSAVGLRTQHVAFADSEWNHTSAHNCQQGENGEQVAAFVDRISFHSTSILTSTHGNDGRDETDESDCATPPPPPPVVTPTITFGTPVCNGPGGTYTVSVFTTGLIGVTVTITSTVPGFGAIVDTVVPTADGQLRQITNLSGSSIVATATTPSGTTVTASLPAVTC